ncbi:MULTISPECIES: efflux RND transporter periplasmic adaptor subunit [Bradyrhizobium]|jgi:multidrug efflux system membrane fusion protein|uniref:RND family efflux transporter, MFP subunit n=2 Tax=Bradyrhizobium TaxID=374 RepID=A0ABY0QF17_9BRAD|nr:MULTISPECIES: efflux RND transporter periplasmic adaptor subunit [Bradyrhizobium]SDK11856.1 RND family efflux transporter, MFP subunit [Bradyrhizobium ottawaense]SEE77926.1 RND family efflux transporter, MFP subunit [Bradyrhizobium lablabi]SHM53295.1 RND family efflux transporter, MFP subunit [Bradyrhizobium lablabi]
MDQITDPSSIEREAANPPAPRKSWGIRAATAVIAAAAIASGAYFGLSERHDVKAAIPPAAAPVVTVSTPLQHDVDTRMGSLGQFSAIDRVELRAQVGGTLTEIHFKDGQMVRKGDLLFVIDPRPYEIRLAQANAALQTAQARVALANNQLSRASSLRRNEFATQETVDQRTSDQDSAQATVEDAKARVRDAQLDLEYCRVTAPFAGRIGARQISIGSLVAGSRAAASPTTLLATLVSLDPLYLDFDMSESDYLTFSRERARLPGPLANKVSIGLSDENAFAREGTLDFVDNAIDRSSGTIHARATVPNHDLFLAPGQFARLRVSVAPPSPVLLLPDAAVVLDQSQHLVMTVAADGTVAPKIVETGDLRGGLRVVRSGLEPGDRVVIDGLVRAVPGMKVAPQDGAIHYDAAIDGRG